MIILKTKFFRKQRPCSLFKLFQVENEQNKKVLTRTTIREIHLIRDFQAFRQDAHVTSWRWLPFLFWNAKILSGDCALQREKALYHLLESSQLHLWFSLEKKSWVAPWVDLQASNTGFPYWSRRSAGQ